MIKKIQHAHISIINLWLVAYDIWLLETTPKRCDFLDEGWHIGYADLALDYWLTRRQTPRTPWTPPRHNQAQSTLGCFRGETTNFGWNTLFLWTFHFPRHTLYGSYVIFCTNFTDSCQHWKSFTTNEWEENAKCRLQLTRLGQTRPDQNRLGGSGLPGGAEVTIQGLIFLTLDATTVYWDKLKTHEELINAYWFMCQRDSLQRSWNCITIELIWGQIRSESSELHLIRELSHLIRELHLITELMKFSAALLLFT